MNAFAYGSIRMHRACRRMTPSRDRAADGHSLPKEDKAITWAEESRGHMSDIAGEDGGIGFAFEAVLAQLSCRAYSESKEVNKEARTGSGMRALRSF